MRVYCTSRNEGSEHITVHMVYLGTSLEKAVKSIGYFSRYQQDDFPTRFIDSYSAIPRDTDREFVRYYTADGWWYSIVMFELEEQP